MVKKRVKRFRGSRTHGGGTHKNRRGAGNRGGRGRAGACKHHFVRALQGGYTYGKSGFKRPEEVIFEPTTINVGQLDVMASALLQEDIAEEVDGAIKFDASRIGVNKILGSGKVTKKLVITATEFSESARRKIEEAGGQAIEE